MTPAQQIEMRDAQREFEADATTNARRAELVSRLVEIANEDPDYQMTCFSCKNAIVFVPFGNALVPGHVYSYDGRREVSITRTCEFCFDHMFENDEDYNGPPTGPQED